MPYRLTTLAELWLGILTFISTIISGNYFLDFGVGVITYFGARILYRLFGLKILQVVEKLKNHNYMKYLKKLKNWLVASGFLGIPNWLVWMIIIVGGCLFLSVFF